MKDKNLSFDHDRQFLAVRFEIILIKYSTSEKNEKENNQQQHEQTSRLMGLHDISAGFKYFLRQFFKEID